MLCTSSSAVFSAYANGVAAVFREALTSSFYGLYPAGRYFSAMIPSSMVLEARWSCESVEFDVFFACCF